MPQSDVQEILLAHDRWATEQILDVCKKLNNEQFHQSFQMGPGSLHNTTTHILGAMRTWTQTLAGQEVTVRLDLDGQQRSPTELLVLLKICTDEFAAQVQRRPLDEIVSRVREGKSYEYTRGTVFAHVITHGMHHRAQCLNMLRQLGIKPLPPSSVAEWVRIVDAKL